jgi:hypothetical protein
MPEPSPAHGHEFNAENVCDRCGMSRHQYDDGGRPYCTGVKPEGIALPVDDVA